MFYLNFMIFYLLNDRVPCLTGWPSPVAEDSLELWIYLSSETTELH